MSQNQQVAVQRDKYGRLKDQLAARAEDFAAVLPSHITPDQFQRTVVTAVQTDPELLDADRASFLTAPKFNTCCPSRAANWRRTAP